jgi:ribonuclease D
MDWAKVKMPFPPSYVADERDESSRSVMCPEFREYRLMLNKLSHFESCHPSPDLVANWTLLPEMTSVTALQSNRQLIYVDSALKFDEMVKHLSNEHSVISLDAEFGQSLYLDCISLFQVSCVHNDYVVDNFLMFPYVKDKLESIFMNPSILKLVFSEHDVRAFVRDHKVYFVGVIDVQEVCSKYINANSNINKPVMSLSEVCKYLLEVDVDKKYQRYNYMLRPVEPKVLEYAANDSKLLLMLWNKLKCLIDVNSVDLSWSKKITMCKYSFPTIRMIDARVDFECVLSQLAPSSLEVKSNLNRLFREKYELFEKLWLCRIECAKTVDRRPKSVMSVNDLGIVFRFLPQNSQYFLSLFPYLKKWDISIVENFLTIIIDHVRSVEQSQTGTVVSEVDKNETWEVAIRSSVSQNDESWEVASCPSLHPDDKKPREMSISPVSSFGSEPDESISLDTLSQNLPVPEGKKALTPQERKQRNYIKKFKAKTRLDDENNLRVKCGLPVISKSKNCGVKKRLRSERRRAHGLFMGATSAPPGGLQSRRKYKELDYSLR